MKINRNRRFISLFGVAGLSGCASWLLLLGLTASPLEAAERQVVHAQPPAAVSRLTPLRPLDSSQRLNLVIGLPVRDSAELTRLLQQLYDPASPKYQQWQSPAELAARFGATEQDLQAVADWAKAQGLTVTSTHSNRLVVEVEGSAGDVQKALHIALHEYKHPTENRTFHAPDTEPSLDLATPVLTIDGLDDYAKPERNGRVVTAQEAAAARARQAAAAPPPAAGNSTDRQLAANGGALPSAGSAPGGNYGGCDFRAAYAPGVALDGTGQSIGLLQYNNFYQADITAYEQKFGLPNVPIERVDVNGGYGPPTMPGNDEVSLDIEMTIAMAPGVAKVYVYDAPNLTVNWVPLLSRMQSDNFCKQLSCSWFGGAPNATAENIFQLMAAQGQSFFNASGDFNAWTNVAPNYIPFPCQSPNITQVGGTTLSTAGPCGAYSSETVWNQGLFNGQYWGSAGGFSTDYSIPWWQQQTYLGSALGSATMRNIPDVALTAQDIWVYYNNGASGSFIGTSCAAPLWAGFMALVNQQAMGAGRPPVGFLNPTLYALGNSTNYNNTLHDITTGNNYWPGSPTRFPAVAGYDLCTGWGSPNGQALINYLAGDEAITPSLLGNGGFETGDFSHWTQGGNTNSTFVSSLYAHAGAFGGRLGPVGTLGTLSQTVPTVPGQSYVVSFWLWNPSGGTGTEFRAVWNATTLIDLVNPSASGWTRYQFTVTASGTSALLEFDFRHDPSYWGLDDIGVTPAPQISVAVANGGFESGSFSGWTQGGNTGFSGVSAGYAHSGGYGAYFGPSGSLGTLSQTIPTVPGLSYVVSFWLENPVGASPTEFKMIWNGSTMMDLVNSPATGWIKYQFTLPANSSSTVLEFDFRNDPAFFGLDDISVSPVYMPQGLTFDDLPASTGTPVPNQYGGVMWYNFYYLDGYHYSGNPSGFAAGIVSPENVAYNAFGAPATISNAVPFNLNSAILTAAWNDNLQVEAKGYLHGALVYDQIYILSASSNTLINFNYRGVTEVDFISSGGTNHPGYSGSGTHFAMDNANITVYQGLTFDDLPVSSGAPVPNGYGDLNWVGFSYLDGVNYAGNPSGYAPGAVSQNSAAYNVFGLPASVVSAVPFNFNSAFLTAAWNDNLLVEAKGYVHGALVYDQSYVLSATTPRWCNFNFLGVTEVDFISSGGTNHPGYGGSGTHFVMDNIDKSYPAQQFDAAYLRSSIGEPWGVVTSDTAMNRVFGTNRWQDLRYQTVNAAALFNPATHFVYMEGSDDNWNDMYAFLNANQVTIQSWVNNGGTLFINAAPNQGSGGSLGFGVTLLYDGSTTFSTNGVAINLANPIFNGPFTPVGTAWSGSYFAHATLSGDGGLIPLINGYAGTVLAELWPGLGHVLFGTMTADLFHSPQPQAANLRANILAYAGGARGTYAIQGTFDDLAAPEGGLTVPNGYLGVNWNNFSYLSGSVAGGGYIPGTLSPSNCAYNAFANPASISSPDPFDFHSAYLTAAWNDYLQLEVKGYNRGVLAYDQTYTLQATMPTLINFDYLGVTEVDFISSGGTNHPGYTGTGTHFAMDNVLLATGNAVASGVDHFLWSVVPSPECLYAPVAVTVTAMDANNNTVSNFNGHVSLNGWSGVSSIEDFDSGVWPDAGWVYTATTGIASATYAHDGAYGVSDPEWAYQTNVVIGAPGDVISWWVRPGIGDGRAYLGFAANATSSWSVVVAPNTSQFIIQKDIPYGTYADFVSEDQTWLPGKWYKISLRFNSPVSVTASLYDSDGITLLHTLSTFGITGAPGGLAIRSFGGFSLDTLQTGNPVALPITPAGSGNFVNGVWTGTVEALAPAGRMVFAVNEGLRGASGSSNPFQVTASTPQLTITKAAGGVNVCWPTCVGVKYQLQNKNGSLLNAWANSGSVLTGTGGTVCVFVSMPPPDSDFFRVVLLP